ncbi:hypothetical protein EMWEY_00058610, partial [Eimeria maxima]
DRERHIADVGG